jgi:hypothetical protein
LTKNIAVMSKKNMSVVESFGIIEEGKSTTVFRKCLSLRSIPALPVFMMTHNYLINLDTFERCEYKPTMEHPLIKEWLLSGNIASRPLPEKYNPLREKMW